MDGVQLPQGYRATTRRQFTFYQQVPRNSWYSFDRPRKDERLSQPLVWESSALTTRPLVHKIIKSHCLILEPKFGDDFLKKELHRTLKEVTSSDLYQKIFNWKIELSKILMNNKKILSLLPVP